MEETAHIIKIENSSRRDKETEIRPDFYTAIDLETTGLDPKKDKIIEIGAVRVEHGSICERFSTFVNPRRALEPQIEELTGITDEMIKDAPDIGEVIGRVAEFCSGLPLLGHHVIFDYSFLKRAAVNCGLSFEKSGIDTLTLCRRFMPEEEKKNLSAACRYYGTEPQPAHRALSDAVSAHLLYQAMFRRHFSECPDPFFSKTLNYKVKKEQPASKKQKEVLRDLLKYHKISLTVQIDYLSRNEISRITDKLIAQYGRIKRGDDLCSILAARRPEK